MPIDVAEPKKLYNDNWDKLWKYATKKEIEDSRVDFQLIGNEDKSSVEYKEITCHLIFDTRMDLTRKSWYMAGGHLTNTPSSISYASVVSQESVIISFLVATLNDLDIIAGDIHNVYLNTETKDKLSSMPRMNGNLIKEK